jgi:hypothetical protein
MSRDSRIKFLNSLSKEADSLFRAFVGTKKNNPEPTSAPPLTSVDEYVPEENKNVEQATTLSPVKVQRTEYEDKDSGGINSRYKKEEDFLVVEFKAVNFNSDGSKSEAVFKHYYNEADPSKSYIEVIISNIDEYKVGDKYNVGSPQYKKLFDENNSKWGHEELIDMYNAENIDRKSLKIQRGTQSGISDKYIDGFVDEYKKSGSISEKEEGLEDWIDNLNDKQKEDFLEALKERRGLDYRDVKSEEEIIEKLEEEINNPEEKSEAATKRANLINPTEDHPIHKRNRALGKSVQGAPVQKAFDIIPDGLNNYRGGTPKGNVKGQLKTMRDEFGIKTILKLDTDVPIKKEREAAESLGLEFIFVNPHKGYQTGKGYVTSLNEILPIMAKGNVFVHCTHGADRTGMAVGAHLKSIRNIADDDIQKLEEIYQYLTQYNRWDSIICNVYADGRENSGYGKYLEGFYPIRTWCKAKPKRAKCKACTEVDKYYPLKSPNS